MSKVFKTVPFRIAINAVITENDMKFLLLKTRDNIGKAILDSRTVQNIAKKILKLK